MKLPFIAITVLLMQLHPVIWISKKTDELIISSIDLITSPTENYMAILFLSMGISIIITWLFFKMSDFSSRVTHANTISIIVGIVLIYISKPPLIDIVGPILAPNKISALILMNIHLFGELLLTIGVVQLFLNLKIQNSQKNGTKLETYNSIFIIIGFILLAMQLNFISRISGIISYNFLLNLELFNKLEWLMVSILSSMIILIFFYKSKLLSRFSNVFDKRIFYAGILFSFLAIVLNEYRLILSARSSYFQLFGEVLLIISIVQVLLRLNAKKVQSIESLSTT